MYRDTGLMIADRPLTGWGIGGWTEPVAQARPGLFADSNMPHNDFLWVGAQGGLPALLSLLVIMVAAVWQAWRRPDIAGRYALAATLIALIASSVNSAMRDAQIGLALLWIAMVYLRLAQEKNDPRRGATCGRGVGRT
jgi:O-antigen ligase